MHITLDVKAEIVSSYKRADGKTMYIVQTCVTLAEPNDSAVENMLYRLLNVQHSAGTAKHVKYYSVEEYDEDEIYHFSMLYYGSTIHLPEEVIAHAKEMGYDTKLYKKHATTK